MANIHLSEELAGSERVIVETQFGPVTGGKAKNGAHVFLGTSCTFSNAGSDTYYRLKRYPTLWSLSDSKMRYRCPQPTAIRPRSTFLKVPVSTLRSKRSSYSMHNASSQTLRNLGMMVRPLACVGRTRLGMVSRRRIRA